MIDGVQRARLFEGLSWAEIDRLGRICERRSFAAGEAVLREGEAGPALFVILEGRAAISKRGDPGRHRLLVLDAGECFGEMSLADGGPVTADVVAEGRLVCLAVPRQAFHRLLEADPGLALKIHRTFVRILCERLRRTNADLVALMRPVE